MNDPNEQTFVSRLYVALLFGLIFMLASCQVQNQPSSDPTDIPQDALQAQSSPPASVLLPTEAQLPTATFQQIEPASPLPEAAGSAELSQDPLRLVLPEQHANTVSAWRPPLYPTPWAPTPYDHFFFSRPIAADQINWPEADYRYGGVFLPDVVHTGVDIPAPFGTPVLAAGPGKVTWAGYGLYALKEDPSDPYGLAVAIRHDFGYQGETLYTVYGHMSEIFVAKGQQVEGGEVIGLVGETGKTTGVHLHFEVRLQKNNYFGTRNPELWMSPPQGWGVLAARIMETNGIPLESYPIVVHSLDQDQYWEVKSYGHGSTNSDPYYNENLVMGDLPAGPYEIWISYKGAKYNLHLEVKPGLVSYFTFRGRNSFKTDMPSIPGSDFTPDFDPTFPETTR